MSSTHHAPDHGHGVGHHHGDDHDAHDHDHDAHDHGPPPPPEPDSPAWLPLLGGALFLLGLLFFLFTRTEEPAAPGAADQPAGEAAPAGNAVPPAPGQPRP